MNIHSFFLIGLVAALTAVTPGCGGSAKPRESRDYFMIRGTVVGHDGKPIKTSHVHRGTEMIEVEADGSFAVPVKKAGFHILRFTGASHQAADAGIYLDSADVTVHVRLGTYDRPEQLDRVELVVMEPLYDERSHRVITVVPMAAQPDGSFIAELPHAGPELFYELGKVVENRYINGTQANGYVYDGQGDYMSRVPVTEGKAIVHFDPKDLVPAGADEDVRVSSPSRRTRAIAEVYRGLRLYQRTSQEMMRLALVAQLQPSKAIHLGEEMTEFVRMELSWRHALVRSMKSEQDSIIRSALLISFFASSFEVAGKAPGIQRLADQTLAHVPASSTLWNIEPGAASLVIQSSTSPGSHRAYIDELIQHLSDREVAGELVLGQLIYADKEERKDDMTRYYRMLTGQFSDTRAAFMAIMYQPDRKLREGKPMPDFTWPAFDQADVRHSLASFRGKVVLIDFWATWCKPCVGEMPGLHEAYEAYGDKGFTILSVATGDDPEAVRTFRAQWPMPWNHVVLTPEQSDQVREGLGLVGLPMAVLLDREGRIVATNMALRGEDLMRTLANAINAQKAP